MQIGLFRTASLARLHPEFRIIGRVARTISLSSVTPFFPSPEGKMNFARYVAHSTTCAKICRSFFTARRKYRSASIGANATLSLAHEIIINWIKVSRTRSKNKLNVWYLATNIDISSRINQFIRASVWIFRRHSQMRKANWRCNFILLLGCFLYFFYVVFVRIVTFVLFDVPSKEYRVPHIFYAI